jgi:molybdopterin-guanine dinucleotide biosynthesis protein A
MGRDKAFLPLGNGTMVEHVAGCVRAAAGRVTLIGAPERYVALGFMAVADRYENCGPLGGVCTALEITQADWSLIAACDMPGLTADFLRDLLAAAENSDADCLIPQSGDRLHPLCAVYHRRALAVARRQILNKCFKMHDFLARLPIAKIPTAAFLVENVNTPQDWASREQ